MTTKDLLKKLNWTPARFMKESGVSSSTAYEITSDKNPDTASSKLARKWLEEVIRRTHERG